MTELLLLLLFCYLSKPVQHLDKGDLLPTVDGLCEFAPKYIHVYGASKMIKMITIMMML